jgi:hypothetical protein
MLFFDPTGPVRNSAGSPGCFWVDVVRNSFQRTEASAEGFRQEHDRASPTAQGESPVYRHRSIASGDEPLIWPHTFCYLLPLSLHLMRPSSEERCLLSDTASNAEPGDNLSAVPHVFVPERGNRKQWFAEDLCPAPRGYRLDLIASFPSQALNASTRWPRTGRSL